MTRRFATHLLRALLTAVACAGCATKPLTLRTTGATTPEWLTLEEAWEATLETWGSRGPYSPAEAEATCRPAERCRAKVVPPSATSSRMRLLVIGLSPGRVDVELRYRQPDASEWLTEHIWLEFKKTPPIPTLELGMDKPPRRFKVDHLSDKLRALGVEHPALCTLKNKDDESYGCFGPQRLLGELRYRSCQHSERCDEHISSGYFELTVHRSAPDGRVRRVAFMGVTRSGWEDLGEWN